MSNLEYEYLRLRRELVMKYGNGPVSAPENKALALILLARSFKRVPDSVSFHEELEILAAPFENMSKPEVKQQLNDLQENFRRNRFIEIIVENPDNVSIHNPLHVTTEAKILAVESLGVTSSGAIDKALSTGQKLGELIGDLYRLYVVEYRAFRKNRNHPIFCLVEEREVEIQQSFNATAVKKRRKGCVGWITMFLILTSCIIISGFY